MDTKTFYSNGKLLITGEYLVLDGTNALALPTRLGQSLIIDQGLNQEINWTSYDSDGTIWFKETILYTDISNFIPTKVETVKNTLIRILHQAYIQNSSFLQDNFGYNIETKLTFARKWGLGTSSTLINNIAQWLTIDAFELLNNSFGGSGYDIACAQYGHPITYRLENGKPIVTPIIFKPEFRDQIYFVYLNQKQSSKSAIENYKLNKKENFNGKIAFFDRLTTDAIEANTAAEFANILEVHESKLSSILNTPTVKELLFPDFEGTVKSLGAWGGDFVMAIATKDPKEYFISKGYETIFTYDALILNEATNTSQL
ncbi:GYDIA family GHMP kinase [Flavobacterium algicola]|uniref:GYDIA family GHMP kinase n=1 Tax=Flavobacterium algicola TaxID=556529 RepID=UPI001EFC40DE|nr:GYDIA family GHMP kinase [Flavobacterium algicola]MCG9794115.1 GHMP kinase [Flavobacterium algicola]